MISKSLESLRVLRMVLCGVAIAILTVCALAMLSGCSSKAYIASDDNSVSAYFYDDNGRFIFATELIRGSEVTKYSKTVEEGNVEYKEIKYDDTTYYVEPCYLVKSLDDIVLETRVFVRTPVTIYENDEGAEIAGFAPKGTELEMLEYDKVNADGYVNMYKISYKGQEGYVFGKYMSGNYDDAMENYNDDGTYDLHAAKSGQYYDLYAGEPKDLDYYPSQKVSIEGNEFCSEARGMYINAEAAMKYETYIDFIKQTNCNLVVIDFKDGELSCPFDCADKICPTANITAYYKKAEFQKAVQAYKDAGLYVVARIVCFNDPYYAKDHPEDCIKSSASTQEWPSAFSRDAWYYNVSLALEIIEDFDVNEIQFDYVRFPEETYNMSQAKDTDFKNAYNEEKCQAIQNFCIYAADMIHRAGAYLSIDVFGETNGGYVTAYGQYWAAISNYVDAISSMPYTDHYGADTDTWSEPYDIMDTWARGAADRVAETPTPSAVRTWITGYDVPNWDPTVFYGADKMIDQIEALYDNGLKGGFIPWNALSNLEKYKDYKDIWCKEYSYQNPRGAVITSSSSKK